MSAGNEYLRHRRAGAAAELQLKQREAELRHTEAELARLEAQIERNEAGARTWYLMALALGVIGTIAISQFFWLAWRG